MTVQEYAMDVPVGEYFCWKGDIYRMIKPSEDVCIVRRVAFYTGGDNKIRLVTTTHQENFNSYAGVERVVLTSSGMI